MTEEEKGILHDRLKRKIEITKEKIIGMEEMTKPVTPDISIGRISRMDAINNKSVMEAALRTARKDLDSMEYALKHIDEEGFGECAKCHAEINLKRLMLMPGSKYCVRCASLGGG